MKTRCHLLAALLVSATAVALSCGDPSPLGVGSRVPAPQANFIDSLLRTVGTYTKGLVKCSPLPYDSVSKTIGPQGDTIQVGLHTLRVPPGALSAPVTITAVAPSDSVNRVDFQPEGLTFAQPVSLVMSYANCEISAGSGHSPETFPGQQPGPTFPGPMLPGPTTPAPTPPGLTTRPTPPGLTPGPPGLTPLGLTPGPTHPEPQPLQPTLQGHGPPLRIAHITDGLEIIEYQESVDDPATLKVTGRLDHFSDYAIAW